MKSSNAWNVPASVQTICFPISCVNLSSNSKRNQIDNIGACVPLEIFDLPSRVAKTYCLCRCEYISRIRKNGCFQVWVVFPHRFALQRVSSRTHDAIHHKWCEFTSSRGINRKTGGRRCGEISIGFAIRVRIPSTSRHLIVWIDAGASTNAMWMMACSLV